MNLNIKAARSTFNGACSQTYQCVKITNLVCNNDQKKCLCYDASFGYENFEKIEKMISYNNFLSYWTGTACSTCTNGQKTGTDYASCVANT